MTLTQPQKYSSLTRVSYDSDRTEREFIKSIVVEVKKVLENIGGKSNERGAPEAPHVNDVIFNVRQLRIMDSYNAKRWTFESISESPTEAPIEVAKMKECYDMKVCGKLDTKELEYGKRYEVVFVVKVEDAMTRWVHPAIAQLMVPNKDLQEEEFQFVDLVKNEWIEIPAGVFDAEPLKQNIEFCLLQKHDFLITGLVIKGAIIRLMKE